MRPARMAAFLQVLLVAGIAVAATPEQEMHAEAKKLLDSLFTKCGEDHFSKRTFHYKSGTAWVISQYKELVAHAKLYPLSKADALNGIEWKAVVQFTASVGREFPHGEQFVKRGLNPKKLDMWSEWKEPNISFAYPIEKKNGVVSIKRRPAMEITAIKCSEIPKG
jgi:hypothetical protein